MAVHEQITLAGQSAVLSRSLRPSKNRLIVFARGGTPYATFAYATDIKYAAADDVISGVVTWNQFHEPLRLMIEYLAERGYIVVTAPLYDTSLGSTAAQGGEYGNDASTTLLASVIADAKTRIGLSTEKYGLLSFSMGCATIANHARRVGFTGIAGMLSFCPLGVIEELRGRFATPGTYYAAVNIAHGLGLPSGTSNTDTLWDAIAAVKEPKNIAPNVTFPWGVWSNSNDLSVPEATQADVLNAAIPSQYRNRVTMGAGVITSPINGHDYSQIRGKDVHDYISTWSW
jgi:hypothetical protein